MKINELKIGDRIKYKYMSGVATYSEYEGDILEIRDTFLQISNNDFYTGQLSVKKEHVISKINHEEIPIDQESKSFKSTFKLISIDIRNLSQTHYIPEIKMFGLIDDGYVKIECKNLNGLIFEVDKEYTIEIKEKGKN